MCRGSTSSTTSSSRRTQAEDYIVYRVLDALTDALYPVVDHLEARIDAIEEAVLSDPASRSWAQIYRLKQEVQSLQRRLVPQRDQFAARPAIIGCPASRAASASTCATSAIISRR